MVFDNIKRKGNKLNANKELDNKVDFYLTNINNVDLDLFKHRKLSQFLKSINR